MCKLYHRAAVSALYTHRIAKKSRLGRIDAGKADVQRFALEIWLRLALISISERSNESDSSRRT